ncbi:diacylglycerol O-acyltransferase 1-like [Oppia nitens]|uniref:diacylglycerol O-acyltransferase 1-like n=1 Tax=Oppia nitens TaxID=1686743 RepID=UPI0023DA9C3A|nr:diacylglycerol O-acyltransferase 1-like [Oppia nitens]
MSDQSDSISVRKRRTNESEITKNVSKNFNDLYLYDPCHTIQESLLSKPNSDINSHGFLNLALILLILSNTRVALNNLITFGVLVDPFKWMQIFVENPLQRPTFILILMLNIFSIISVFIEKYVVIKKISENKANYLIIANIFAILVTPLIVNILFECNLLLISLVCAVYSIVILKLISYHCVNHWCRTSTKYGKPITSPIKVRQEFIKAFINNNKVIKYPNNIGFIDMYYFLFVPTLCYQINFPQTSRIRLRFILLRLIENAVLLQVIIGLIQQWIIPGVQNSLEPFNNMEYSKILSRLLLLAIPNHIVWLIFFYWYFHSMMNLMAEILRFGDRDFYHDWWNSESVDQFWRNWNIPVHKWCKRHLYKPLLTRGFTQFQASLAVFIVSAFFHEYIVSLPLKMFEIWSFAGMLSQIPFTIFVSLLKGRAANCAIWLQLIIGQPLAILMYYHDYYVTEIINQNVTVSFL